MFPVASSCTVACCCWTPPLQGPHALRAQSMRIQNLLPQRVLPTSHLPTASQEPSLPRFSKAPPTQRAERLLPAPRAAAVGWEGTKAQGLPLSLLAPGEGLGAGGRLQVMPREGPWLAPRAGNPSLLLGTAEAEAGGRCGGCRSEAMPRQGAEQARVMSYKPIHGRRFFSRLWSCPTWRAADARGSPLPAGGLP